MKNQTKSSKSKSNKSSKSRRPQYVGHSRHFTKFTDEDKEELKSLSNDPSWYTGNSNIAFAASNLPFNFPAGYKFNVWETKETLLTLGKDEGGVEWYHLHGGTERSVPGVLQLITAPAFGEYVNAASPLNIASQALYAFVRHANSGSRNYDAPDLTTYIIAMSQVYSYINFLMRAYGLITNYSAINKYWGMKMAEVMHLDYSDITGRMADFNYYINLLISKASAFAVPANITYFQRMAFMYQNVYIESGDIKDQMYMYYPGGFYFYTIDDTHDEAYLKYHAFVPFSSPDKLFTLQDMVDYGNAMIQPLLDTEDIGIASGDILKAYGSNIIKLMPCPMDYRTPILYDTVVLEQMQNATIVYGWSYSDLYQNPTKAYLMWDNAFKVDVTNLGQSEDNLRLSILADLNTLMSSRILTTRATAPTADNVIENTRLMVIYKDVTSTIVGDGNTQKHGVITGKAVSGSEVVTEMRLYNMYDPIAEEYYGSPTVKMYGMNSYLVHRATESEFYDFFGLSETYKAPFNYAPLRYLFHFSDTTTGGYKLLKYFGISGNLDTVTVVDVAELGRIHESAWMNLIAVQPIALVNSVTNKSNKGKY
nr:putative capsid [Marmot picobirnavirus]